MRADYGNDSLNETIESLRPLLPTYLSNRGILPEDWSRENNKNFKCINPDHEDNSPSMCLVPVTGYTVARCWSCSAKADIFKAATWIDGKPDSGKEWVNENVYSLAEEFEISFVKYEPTPEELAKARILEMLADASDCLVGLSFTSKKCDGLKHVRVRGIKEETAKELSIGTVDWKEFLSTMKKYGGWEEEFLRENGVTDLVFGQEFLTITLKDHRGIVVGFDRRYMLWNKEDEASARKLGRSNEYPKKWFLPRKSDIFDPRTFLYGLDTCKDSYHKRLDIFEGYIDRIIAYQSGHTNVVSCCGTNGVKQEQIDLLVKIGFEDICLVFDSDKAGKSGMEHYLKQYGDRRDIRLTFKFLEWPTDCTVPDKDRDPDTFFRLYCQDNISKYEDIPVISAFRLALNLEVEKGTKGEELARLHIPFIAAEPDAINRGKMIIELSIQTGVPEIDIRSAVEHALSGIAKNVAKDLARRLQNFNGNINPIDISVCLKEAEEKLSPLYGGSANVVTYKAAKSNFFTAIDAFDNDRGVIAGFRTDIPMIDDGIGGVQMEGYFMVISGNPNSGKSAFVHKMVSGLLKNHKDNKGSIILYFSFDDTVNWTWAKQIACFTDLPISWVARPQKYIYHDPDLTKEYNKAKDFFRDSVGNRIRIFGGDIGMNISQIKKAIRNANETSGDHCIIVVDSFNKMSGKDGQDGRAKHEFNADELHALVHDGNSVICTAENVKASQGRKGTMGDIADTKRLTYNATLIATVYNPLHEERDQAQFFHVVKKPDGSVRKAPVIQIDIAKNKITEFKEPSIFQFFDSTSNFKQIDDIHGFMRHQNALWNSSGKPVSLSSGPKTTVPGSLIDIFGNSKFPV